MPLLRKFLGEHGFIDRKQLDDSFGLFKGVGVSATSFGAVSDYGITPAATNDAAILLAANSLVSNASGGIVVIDPGVKWSGIPALTIPAQVQIFDNSGYDWAFPGFTGQIKLILNTPSPGTKNAHELKVLATYHPAVIVDNVGDGATERRSSLVFRFQGASDWQIGTSVGAGSARALQTAFYGVYAGTTYSGGTVIAGVDPLEGNFGRNSGPVSGIDDFFTSVRNNTSIRRHTATLTNGIENQYANGGGLKHREQYADDGSFSRQVGGLQFDFISPLGEVSGTRYKVLNKAGNYTFGNTDSGVIATNTAVGAVTFTLPVAVSGLTYPVVISNGAITLTPNGTDKFRAKAASASYVGSTLGEFIVPVCIVPGIWDLTIKGGGFV